MPHSLIVNTTSGGLHIYAVGDSERRSCLEGDIKSGEGSYVLGPGSIAVNRLGGQGVYTCAVKSPIASVNDRLCAELITSMTTKRPGARSGEHIYEAHPFRAAGRNNTLTSDAGRLVRHLGFTPDEIKATLIAINRLRYSPPLPETEIDNIAVQSGGWERSGDSVADEAIISDAFYLAGDPIPPIEPLPMWQPGWGIPARVALIGDAGAGKSTILAQVAAWYVSRGKSVVYVAAEACDEVLEARERYDEDWDVFDWTIAAPLSLADSGRTWDVIVVDPGIGALSLYDLAEDTNGIVRQVDNKYLTPALNPGGHVWMSWHVGHTYRGRGRGQSDIKGWARLAALYVRDPDSPVGLLSEIKKNRGYEYPRLTVTLDDGLVPHYVVDATSTATHLNESQRDNRLNATLETIRESPGIGIPDLQVRIGVSESTMRSYLTALEASSGIRREREGRVVRLYPPDD